MNDQQTPDTHAAGWDAAKDRAMAIAHLYALLIEHAGANPRDLPSFMAAQFDRERPCPEYRFQGELGFGGKLIWDQARGFRVTCYPEDRTPERDQIITTTNRALYTHGLNRDPRDAPEPQ